MSNISLSAAHEQILEMFGGLCALKAKSLSEFLARKLHGMADENQLSVLVLAPMALVTD